MEGYLPYEEVKQRLLLIPKEDHKVFLMLVYSCMSRVGEVVKGKYRNNPPITSSQVLEKIRKDGARLLVITLLTEKSYQPRRVPLNREKEGWLTEPILAFSKQTNGPLFPYTTRWGEKVFQKYFPEYNQHIHLLRSWRASHQLSGQPTGKPLPSQVVIRMGGWTTEETMNKSYNKTVIEDYEDLL